VIPRQSDFGRSLLVSAPAVERPAGWPDPAHSFESDLKRNAMSCQGEQA
jgi:hypothetical protein